MNFERIGPPASRLVASIDWGKLAKTVADPFGAVTDEGYVQDALYGEKPTRPVAGDPKYFGTAEGNAADTLQRAYGVADRAGQFQSNTYVREPTAVTADQITPERVDAMTGALQRASAAQVSAPRAVASPQLGSVERIAAPTAAQLERVAGVQTGPAALTAKTSAGAGPSSTEAEGLLRQAATGAVPSKAEALLNSGLDKTAKKQLSLAASAKGSERRGARRGAMLAIGEQGADVAQQAAALRADELARGRTEFSQSQQQTQRLQQDTQNLQAQIDAAAARGDADAVNRLRGQQADLTARSQEVNAGAGNARGETDAARAMAAAAANASATNARALDQAQLGLHADEGNVTRETQVALDNAGRSTGVELANAAASQRRQEQQQATAESNAARAMAAAAANQQTKLDAAKSTEQLRQSRDVQEINREQQDQQLRQGGQLGALGAANSAVGTQADIAGKKLVADTGGYTEANQERKTNKDSVVQTGLGIASVLSSEKVKDNIKPIGEAEAIGLANAYGKLASTYNYIGSDDQTAGVVAEDLQRHPVGKQFVHERPGGILGVDYNGLNATVLKGLAAKLDHQASRSQRARRA